MTPGGPRVIKLGGSLLEWPAWVETFRDWLGRQTPAQNVIVVGGGKIVDQVREFHRVYGFSDEAAHWLAVRSMGVTAALVAELLPEAVLLDSVDELKRAPRPCVVFDVEQLLRDERGTGGGLPCGWHVTSDSIAAHVAQKLNACELVLLKSAGAESANDQAAWAEQGLVDPYFVQAVDSLIVRYVNLRVVRAGGAGQAPQPL